MKKLMAFVLALALYSFAVIAQAQEVPFPLTRVQFETLATELAPKVNLFRDVWQSTPDAQFFGGTSRDYLYWLKGKLVRANAEGRLAQEITKLRATKTIDVREFILFESDVDVVSEKGVGVDGARYGIKKIDHITAKRFDPATPEGQNELKQGFIPIEKIRLGRAGFVRAAAFGDGLGEVYSGRPTVHFSSKADFASTHYAQQGINHPILLALRFLRLAGINYFQTHGAEFPNRDVLLKGIDPASAAAVKTVIEDSIKSGELKPLLANEKFAKWLNGTIQKAFRSYTNPTAAKMLFEAFGAARLPSAYVGIEQFNQYLFRKLRDERSIEANWKKFGVTANVLENFSKTFPDGRLYHGTRDEVAFRSILFQGIMPSSAGAAGAGLYGVASNNVDYAVKWANDERLVVQIDLDPSIKIVDIRPGHPGYELFDKYVTSQGRSPTSSRDLVERFAEAFGFDIVSYPYETHAFVLNNADKIRKVQGWKRKLLKFEDLRTFVESRKITPQQLLQLASDNSLAETEVRDLFELENAKRALGEWSKFDGKAFLSNVDFIPLRSEIYFYMVPHVRESIIEAVKSLTLEEFTTRPQWLQNLVMYSPREVTRTVHPLYFLGVEGFFAEWTKSQLESKLVESYGQKNGLLFTSVLFELERRSGNLQDYERMTRFNGANARSNRADFDPVLLELPRFFTLEKGPDFSVETTMELLRLEATHKAQEMAERVAVFGVGHPHYNEFLMEIAARPDAIELLMHSTEKFKVDHKTAAWTALDDAIVKAIESGRLASLPQASNRRWTVGTLGTWIERVMGTDAKRVPAKALLELAKFAATDHRTEMTWDGAIKIHLNLLKSPRLANTAIGRQIAEIMIGNSESNDWWKFTTDTETAKTLKAGLAPFFETNGWDRDPMSKFYQEQSRSLFRNADRLARAKAEFLATLPASETSKSGPRAARSCQALF